MQFVFKKATKEQSKLRMAVLGPSGSGKTFSALRIAAFLGKKVAVVCTERGSASKYSHLFEFDVLELKNYAPENYTSAIKAAAEAGYEVLIIDSLSHAWAGIGGALEMADKATVRAGNKFAAWREVTPRHNELVDAILQAPMHIIVTMRVKTEYVLEENEKGKKVPRRVGIQPIQRDGVEYEFDVIADMDLDHNMSITKTRCETLDRAVIHKPGEEVAKELLKWLSDGAEPAPRLPSFVAPVNTGSTEGPEETISASIEEASSEQDLVKLVPQIKALSPEAQGRIRVKYSAKRSQFSGAA